MTKWSCEAGAPLATSTGVDRAVDVDFVLTGPGIELHGEVTLLPCEDGSPYYSSWGAIDNWLDSDTVRALRAMSDRDFDAAREAILSATCDAAGRP